MMLSAREVADKWGVSLRYVQTLCKNGRIPGAENKGKYWLIPADAVRPVDGRSKAAKQTPQWQPLIRKSPFLDMTDLYNTPGTADQCIASLENYPEAQALFAAEIAYSRGQTDKVYAHAQEILSIHSGFYSVIAGGMLMGLLAIWKGDLRLWNEAHRHFYEAPCRNDMDRDIIALSLASADILLRNTDEFPEWFTRGCFDNLPKDSHPAARVFYMRYLMVTAQDLAMGKAELDGVKGIGFMRMLPYVLEPMISQMVVDKIVMAEIYLRLTAAVAYHQCGDDVRGSAHLDKAIKLCLPDGLYGPLVEHRRQLGPFLDDRLSMIDPEALKTVKLMHKQFLAGWTKLHNAALDRAVQVSLTGRERQVARLASFGMTDSQIAAQLHLSESSVKAAIRTAKNKTGVNTRSELAIYV